MIFSIQPFQNDMMMKSSSRPKKNFYDFVNLFSIVLRNIFKMISVRVFIYYFFLLKKILETIRGHGEPVIEVKMVSQILGAFGTSRLKSDRIVDSPCPILFK